MDKVFWFYHGLRGEGRVCQKYDRVHMGESKN